MIRVTTALDHVPQSIQHTANWTSIGGATASFVGIVQGPLAVIASVLSIIWLGLQIITWLERRLRPAGKRRKGDR